MKFVCLGFMDERKWKAMSPSDREAWLDECFAFDCLELRAVDEEFDAHLAARGAVAAAT
jgi:hypothetical protein